MIAAFWFEFGFKDTRVGRGHPRRRFILPSLHFDVLGLCLYTKRPFVRRIYVRLAPPPCGDDGQAI